MHECFIACLICIALVRCQSSCVSIFCVFFSEPILYDCEFCGKVFNHKGNWRVHIDSIHKGKVRLSLQSLHLSMPMCLFAFNKYMLVASAAKFVLTRINIAVEKIYKNDHVVILTFRTQNAFKFDVLYPRPFVCSF